MLDRAKRLLAPSARSDVPPFIVMDVMAAAARIEAAGGHVIHMEVGQPAAPAPRTALNAAAAALAVGRLQYTEALGIPSLRARIARHYAESYRLPVDADRIVVTTGSSGGFILAFLTLFEPGDRVAVANPGYPPYRHILTALGCEPVLIETGPSSRYALTPDALIAAHRQKPLQGVLVASPANPTGTMLAHSELAALIERARELGIGFVSDEIYHGLHYGARAVSALEISDEVYVINSFSKYFSMTGWRIGWMVVPQAHVRRIERLIQNLFICAPHASQVTALAALDATEELEKNRAVYRANRALLLEGLPKAGFGHIAPPDGAFYVYADVSELTDDSRALAARILAEAGVAVTPGLDFDPVRGARTLRFSYAGSTADIAEGLRRLEAWAAPAGLSAGLW
jgi:aspartate/methionine/tyrosine aminotransferase